MQAELDRNFPSTDVEFLAVNEFGQESANSVAAANTNLPLLQDVDANSNGQSDVWHDSWGIAWRDVVILNSENVRQGAAYSLTTHDLADSANYQALRTSIVSAITADRTAATVWQNPTEPLDMNNDRFVAAQDALVGINELNSRGSYMLQTPTGPLSSYLDVNGDQFISSLDVLMIINHLNRMTRLQSAAPVAAAAVPVSTSALPSPSLAWTSLFDSAAALDALPQVSGAAGQDAVDSSVSFAGLGLPVDSLPVKDSSWQLVRNEAVRLLVGNLSVDSSDSAVREQQDVGDGGLPEAAVDEIFGLASH